MEQQEREKELDELASKLRYSIEACTGDIVELEELEERFFDSMNNANSNSDIGKLIRYHTAHNHIKQILEQAYSGCCPVGNDGKLK